MSKRRGRYDYARESFGQAVDALATGDGDIQERLARAALFLIQLEKDLPEHLREEFKTVWDQLTKENATADADTLAVTTRKFSIEQGKQLARRILRIYTQLYV
jgi:hypothetical protein